MSETVNHEIDPTNHNNYRSEWRLEANKVYSAVDLRICNLGLYGVGNKEYLHNTGIKSLIKHIHIMDGNEQLASIRNYNKYSAYKEYNKSNDRNRDTENVKHATALGFTTHTVNNTNDDIPQVDIVQQALYNNTMRTQLLEDTSHKGFINLAEEFDFLMQSLIIPTNLFKNFRVVVEYETNFNKVLLENGLSPTRMRPFLFVKELINPDEIKKELSKFKGSFIYNEIEQDNYTVPQNAADEVQETRRKVHGFMGKYVEDLVIQKEPTYHATQTHSPKNLCSVRQANERFNMTLNGKKMLPFEGINSLSKQLGVLNISQGEHNKVYDGLDAVQFYTSSEANVTGTVMTSKGVQDYLGINIMDTVNDLQLEYDRQTSSTDNYLNQALNLNFYGKVNKVFNNDGQSYEIFYR